MSKKHRDNLIAAGKQMKDLAQKRATLMGGTAPLPQHDIAWRFQMTRNGTPTGEEHNVSATRAANSFVWLAKRQLAEEARRKSDPGPSNEEPTKAELREWLRHPIHLEKPQHSIAHQIMPPHMPTECHALLIQHDWAAVMSEAVIEGTGGEIRPPYPVTAFEFLFNGGVHAVAIMHETRPEDVVLTFKTKSGWVQGVKEQAFVAYKIKRETPEGKRLAGVYSLISQTITAVCIMLDAQIAETTPMRAPYKSNEARAEHGPLPKYSYHTVSLVNRHRVTPLHTPGGEPSHHKRLHFRRGHWRHYETHKTWIKWTLVGNPDLGFVDKEYSL